MSEQDFSALSTTKSIQLSHGGGGQEMSKLIKGLFFKAFDNAILRSEEDAAVLTLKVKLPLPLTHLQYHHYFLRVVILVN